MMGTNAGWQLIFKLVNWSVNDGYDGDNEHNDGVEDGYDGGND